MENGTTMKTQALYKGAQKLNARLFYLLPGLIPVYVKIVDPGAKKKPRALSLGIATK